MKIVKVNVSAQDYVPLEQLTYFQEEIKTLPKTEYEKLRKSIIDNGIVLALHVWANDSDKTLCIIDGHQRVWTLHKMKEDGWEIPKIPVNFIEAKSYQEAKALIPVAASVHGKLNADALQKFIEGNNIDIEQLASVSNLPGIKMEEFAERFIRDQIPPEGPAATPPVNNQMPVSSEGVKQVVLFFDSKSHQEFLTKINELSKDYGKESVTDTVMEAVREAHKALN